MEFGDLDRADDGNGCGEALPAVSCTICLDIITDNGGRSSAKLQCGHQFHLDCIGSAFNAKGAMECPNCRKIEKGQWIYSNSSRSYAEFNMENRVHDGFPYYSSNSDMTFVVNSGPLHGFTQLPSSFEDGISAATSMLTPYPDSATRSRERMLALQAYFQNPPGNSQGVHSPLLSSARRANGHMNMTRGEPGVSLSEQASGSYFSPSTLSAGSNLLEAQNSMPNHFHAWEREQYPYLPSSEAEIEPIWVPFHELPGSPNTGIRPAYIRRRYG